MLVLNLCIGAAAAPSGTKGIERQGQAAGNQHVPTSQNPAT